MKFVFRFLLLLQVTCLFTPFLRGQSLTSDAGFVLKGVVRINGKPVEGAALELKKNGTSLHKILTTRNGKFTLRMSVNDSDKTFEYILSVSKEGTVPKTLSINTYVPRNDFLANPFSAYDFDLEIELLPTTVSDVVIEFPFGKIRWYSDQGAYALDQVYAKMIKKEENKLKEDPDKYLKELAEKRNKDELDKRKEEPVSVKHDAVEPPKPVSEVTTVPAPAPLPAPVPAAVSASPAPAHEQGVRTEAPAPSIKKIVETPGSRDASLEQFKQMTDPVQIAQVSEAYKKQKNAQATMERKKSANLSTKYESNNPMTSLLDAADDRNRTTQKHSK
ncbi:MAG TPA: hypothetical protein VNZ86_12850 [Bacteroidia bacterium]|jgi:hypothetical protein|nr:hypothetical protein [Bacteroidia bacterium]